MYYNFSDELKRATLDFDVLCETCRMEGRANKKVNDACLEAIASLTWLLVALETEIEATKHPDMWEAGLIRDPSTRPKKWKAQPKPRKAKKLASLNLDLSVVGAAVTGQGNPPNQ